MGKDLGFFGTWAPIKIKFGINEAQPTGAEERPEVRPEATPEVFLAGLSVYRATLRVLASGYPSQ